MRRITKNAGQELVTLMNFAGGLNSATPSEFIDPTQLAECINMEISSTGYLRTVQGTRDIAVGSFDSSIKGAAFDSINNTMLVFCKDKKGYALIDGQFVYAGTLTGDSEIITTAWEDGLLIASGSYLQYGKKLEDGYVIRDIYTSPAACGGVSSRSGRVFVFDDNDTVRYSGVGDEEYWEENSNDPSAALFAQIGYKVGGRIVGMINFNSYVLIIKDNGKVYRLDNEYPDWTIKEVTSNGACKGKAAYASIGSGVFILGESTLQQISPTDDYGNMPMNYIGKQIENEIASLPPGTKLRFNTRLNQLWFVTGSQWVLVFDCNTQTFFQRYFNADVVDVVGDFIIKKDRVSTLVDTNDIITDNGEPLYYKAKFKTEMGLNGTLVKDVALSFTPLISFYDEKLATLKVGDIKVEFPCRQAGELLQDVVGVGEKATVQPSSHINGYDNDVAYNMETILVGRSIMYKKRQVCRRRKIDVKLEGRGYPFILNFINYGKVGV